MGGSRGTHDAVWRAIYGSTSGSGVLDQYFTPPDVALAMAAPFAGRPVYDPCCGSGNLLAAAGLLAVKEGLRGGSLLDRMWGNEIDPLQRTLCIRRLVRLLRKYHQQTDTRAQDILQRQITGYDFKEMSVTTPKNAVILANPPYSHWLSFMEKFGEQEGSYIVPVSVGDADRSSPIRQSMGRHAGLVCLSFDTRPSPLFPGVEQRLMLIHAIPALDGHWVGPFVGASKQERKRMWEAAEVTRVRLSAGVWPKLSAGDEEFYKYQATGGDRYEAGNTVVWVRTSGRYSVAAAWEPPTASSKWKPVFLTDRDAKRLHVAFRNGDVYRWWRIYGNGRDFPLRRFLRDYVP